MQPIDEEDWYTIYSFPARTYNDAISFIILTFRKFFLNNLDTNEKEMAESFTGSKETAMKLISFWWVFLIQASELGAYNDGEEWMVSHIIFKRKGCTCFVVGFLSLIYITWNHI